MPERHVEWESAEELWQRMLREDSGRELKPLPRLDGPVAHCSSGLMSLQVEALLGCDIRTISPDPEYL